MPTRGMTLRRYWREWRTSDGVALDFRWKALTMAAFWSAGAGLGLWVVFWAPITSGGWPHWTGWISGPLSLAFLRMFWNPIFRYRCLDCECGEPHACPLFGEPSHAH